ncbi:divalent-cation tolerance protein CutA [Streptomyces sp. H27-D2]|uniref:divalent-cation tolerance protein CutA n=1 Tax=Streptomyces sp. H27-D2 TaxID=3046304 RepID=UPI002DB8E9D5|nr:divalent-cation tolerance protein CutA [Streptomyces sp. H27-D2]MEC4016651.1 divalent-cation tolerance protein CutA [Streptomyces sp. H27-D2]
MSVLIDHGKVGANRARETAQDVASRRAVRNRHWQALRAHVYPRNMTDCLHVYTATESRETAVALGRSATEARLAAGVQVVGPVASLFWHLGEFGEGEEWQVIFKTTAARYPALEAHLLQHHPWKSPEITAVPVVAGAAAYVDWVSRTVAD